MKLKVVTKDAVSGKTVLYRSPYDIGTKKVNGEYQLKDDARIKATIPTIKFLIENNVRYITHSVDCHIIRDVYKDLVSIVRHK